MALIKCIAPDEIEDGDLIAYLEGAASPQTIQHIERCAFCEQEAIALQQMDSLVTIALWRRRCPDMDSLLMYQADLLVPDERQHLETHIKDCPHCQTELSRLAVSAPDTLSDSAATLPAQVKEAGRKILNAILIPASQQPAFALRGDGRKQQHTYQAGSYQIVLVPQPPLAVEQIWQIEGQIFYQNTPLVEVEGVVQLVDDETIITQADITEFGLFLLEGVKAGHYALLIQLPAETITIDDIHIS